MAIRWEDIKEKSKEVINEFRGQRIGVIGLGIIVALLIIALLAPVLAPGLIGSWEDTDRWRDVPNGVPPTWWDYFTSDDLTPQSERIEPDEFDRLPAGRFEEVTFSYNFDYQYDEPPTNLALYLDGTYDANSSARSLQIELIRPDETSIRFVDETIRGGELDNRYSLIGRNRDRIYDWADGLGVIGEREFSMDRAQYEQYLQEGPVARELRERFIEEDIDLDELIFSMDQAEYEEYLTDGPITDPIRERFEEEEIEFYESLLTLNVEYEEHLEDGITIHEDHPFRDAFGEHEISEDALLYREAEDIWWIRVFDEDTELYEMEYRIEVTDDALEVFEINADIVEENGVWWIRVDDEDRYRIESDNGVLEVYPHLEITERDGIYYISAVEDYRIEIDGDRLIVYRIPVIRRERVNHARTLFGKADADLLTPRPTPLNGEYELRVSLVSEDIEFNFGEDSGRYIIMGSMYGWMGTDNRGRDIGLGWVWGARYALLLGAIIGGSTISIGTLFGMTSAYLGGWKDEFMQRINEIVIGIPILPILIIMMFIWRQSFWVMVGLMTILYWRGIAKTIRARGLQIRQETYVEAASSLGAGSGRIITTHMVPQILPYSMAEGALLVPAVVIMEASLSVLGLGDPQLVTWGKLLSQAQGGGATVRGLWWWVLLPGIGITLLGFGFIAVGMAIERVVNPKMKQR